MSPDVNARDPGVAQIFLAYFERAPEYEAMTYYHALFGFLVAAAAEEGYGEEVAYLRLSTIIYQTGSANGEIPAARIEDDGKFVTYLYGSVLGRMPDPGGHAHWLAALEDGMSRPELVDIFLRAAAQDPRDGAYIGNRTEVALAFAQWQNSNPELLPKLKYDAAEVLQGVGEDPASVAEGMARLQESQPVPPPPGPDPDPVPPPPPPPEEAKTFVLTVEADDLTGTARDDVFLAPARHHDLTLAATLQSFDTLVGGGGFDRLEADLYGSHATPTMVDIERITVYNTAQGVDGVLDLASSSGHRELEILASTGNVRVTAAGALDRILIAGDQVGPVVVEGIATTLIGSFRIAEYLALELQGVSSGDLWTELWFGDESSTYAQDGPYVFWAQELDLSVNGNTQGVLLNNIGSDVLNIEVAGTNHIRFLANAVQNLNISGSGALWLYESAITGHYNLWGEHLRGIDARGFDGQLSGIWISDSDDPQFAGAEILLGGGRQTIGFDTFIADGVIIHGVDDPDSWTTLELMRNAYDSLAGFSHEQVRGIDHLVLMEAADAAHYSMLHGSTFFTFGEGIGSGLTTTLEVFESQVGVGLRGNLAAGRNDGALVVQGTEVLESLALRLENWGANSDLSPVLVEVALAATELHVDLSLADNPYGSNVSRNFYTVVLADTALVDGPEGSIETILLTGGQALTLDLTQSTLGTALQTIDASEMTGYLDLVLSGHSGIDVTASQSYDFFFLDTREAGSLGYNTIHGLESNDSIVLRVDGVYAGDAEHTVAEIDFTVVWDTLDEALLDAFGQLDSSAGGRAGWFGWDDQTFFLSKEGQGADERWAVIAVDGNDWVFDAYLLDDQSLELWFL